MPSTTLKLSDDLKRRITKIVRNSDTTMHAFLVEAAERATEIAERRAEFVAAALRARDNFAKTRRAYTHEEIVAWTRKKIAGTKERRPKARVWR